MQLNFKSRLKGANWLTRLILTEELKRLSNYEANVAVKSDKSVLVSARDARCFESKNIVILPLGVEVSSFSSEIKRAAKPTICFSGNLGYQPNFQAIDWFLANCLSRVTALFPDLEFRIIGVGASKRNVSSWTTHKNVVVTGFVKDMREELRRCHVAIVPLLSGSGMQNKVLESMACGLPVVTSSIGLGDIRARHGVELLVADSAEDFTDYVCRLLSDATSRAKISCAGKRFVRKFHSWETIESRYLAEFLI